MQCINPCNSCLRIHCNGACVCNSPFHFNNSKYMCIETFAFFHLCIVLGELQLFMTVLQNCENHAECCACRSCTSHILPTIKSPEKPPLMIKLLSAAAWDMAWGNCRRRGNTLNLEENLLAENFWSFLRLVCQFISWAKL